MHEELEANSEWYLERVTQSNYDNALREAAGKYEYLTLLHAAALANYLKRPVFVVDEEQNGRIYGPGHQGAVCYLLLHCCLLLTAAVLPPAHYCSAASCSLLQCCLLLTAAVLYS